MGYKLREVNRLEFIASMSSDIGTTRKTNQDSTTIKIANTNIGKVAFIVVCDGMGGLAKGELASATVIKAFSDWFYNDFPTLIDMGLNDAALRSQWENIIRTQNEKIMSYGRAHGFNLGTTATVMLLTNTRYYLMNVGDTRAYEIYDTVRQLTEDQTVVAQELKYGRITYEQSLTDPRGSVLLQCVGASQLVVPDMFFGETKQNAVYLLCSDGFRHVITNDEIYQCFNAAVCTDANIMKNNAEYLIELDKQRNEKDNITVSLVRTY